MENDNPKRERYKGEDYILTEQSFHSNSHLDSRVKIQVSDRGQATPKPSRDLSIEFARVSAGDKWITGQVSFRDGKEVKLLIDYLNDKFDSSGHRRDPEARTYTISDGDKLEEDRRNLADECGRLRDHRDRIRDQRDEMMRERDALRKALTDIIDATEDKNGQFSAWHKVLRETTKAGKLILNPVKDAS